MVEAATHPPGPRPRGLAARRRAPLLLVVLSLVPVLVLAWKLHHESAAHRRDAETMLDDCAMLAAEDYVRRLSLALDVGVLMPLGQAVTAAERAGGRGALPPQEPDRPQERGLLDKCAKSFFSYDPASGEVTTTVPLPEPDRWLVPIARRFVDRPSRQYQNGLFIGPRDEVADQLVVVGCLPRRDAEGRVDRVVGFVGSWPMFQRIFGAALGMGAPLLGPLVERASGQELVTIVVRHAGGRTLFASGDVVDEAVVRTAELHERHSALKIDARLDRDSVVAILMGELPGSRWVEISLLVLAAIVPLLGALHLLRREQELARQQSGFAASVSHELRTPLAQIRMFAETLRLGRVRSEEDRERSLEILDREARRLQNLVENILHFARAERGTLRVHPVAQEVVPVVREVVDTARPLARARGMELTINAAPCGEAMFDREALRTTLLNFLDNAIKYGPEGQTVTVRCARDDGVVRIDVVDQGPGVAPADREHVWRSFWRSPGVDASVTGAGIGLALVHELADLQGARVAVDEAHDGGARFSLSLPGPTGGAA